MDPFGCYAEELLEAINGGLAILFVPFNHDGLPPSLLAGNTERAGASKAVVDDITEAATVKNEPSEQANRLLGGVERASVGFWTIDYRMVFGLLKLVRAAPAISNKLVGRQIVHPTNDWVVFDPDEQLSEFPTRLLHSCSESKYHSVRVKDVGSVFCREVWHYRGHPIFRERGVLCFGGNVVVEDSFALFELAKSFFRLNRRYPIRHVAADGLNPCLSNELIYKLRIAGIAASEYMLPKSNDGSVLN